MRHTVGEAGGPAWTEGILASARALDLSPSEQRVRLAADWSNAGDLGAFVAEVANAAGMEAQPCAGDPFRLPGFLYPVLCASTDSTLYLLRSVSNGQCRLTILSGASAQDRAVKVDDLRETLAGPMFSLKEREAVRDARIDEYLAPAERSWTWMVFAGSRRVMLELLAGSFFSSIIALTTSLFSMQLWDRVIPARSTNTLWVLAAGVVLASIADLLIRMARTSIVDHFGKRADRKLSAMFFARTLDIKNDYRPKSPGSLISQLRDLDQIREFLTSTAFGALLDLPFVATFLFVIWVIGGSLVIIPLAVVPIIIALGLLAQIPLSRLAHEGMAESTLRNTILMESIYSIEDIKLLQAERRFLGLWEKTTDVNAAIGLKQRHIGALLMNLTQNIQQGAYVAVLIMGVYLVLEGKLSSGALLGCSILTSRTIAPLAQIAAILSRLQNARAGQRGLSALMKLPVDHPPNEVVYHRPAINGTYKFENVLYAYGKEEKPALAVASLVIKPGERIALLGKVGSGKSTLLKLIAGLAAPGAGQITLEGTNMRMIDVADIRRDVGLLLQDSRLFYGTIRDNMTIARPRATDEQILEALRQSCADQLLLNQPHGLDLIVREGGIGLSGGQRQSLLLARLILRSPNIVLLDEPTASLDETTEKTIVENLRQWSQGRTLVVATHRYPILDLVDRIIVLDNGRIALDGPRDAVLARLRAPAA